MKNESKRRPCAATARAAENGGGICTGSLCRRRHVSQSYNDTHTRTVSKSGNGSFGRRGSSSFGVECLHDDGVFGRFPQLVDDVLELSLSKWIGVPLLRVEAVVFAIP